MSDLSGAGLYLTAVRNHLHGEILRVIHERGLTNDEVQAITGRRFDRHKKWKLAEGPDAIRWSPATFIDVAAALGVDFEIRISGKPVAPRKMGRTTASRPVGSTNRSPAIAA